MAPKTIVVVALVVLLAASGVVEANSSTKDDSAKSSKTPAPPSSQKGPRQCHTLLDYLNYYEERFSILRDTIEDIPELKKWATDFKDKAPAKNFTILLWTDRTFTNFLEGVGLNSTVLEDLPRMEAIIRNHILLDSKDSYKDGTEVKTALPGHSLTVYNVDEQVCFSSWSYGCSQGKKLDLGYICQGAFARVNSILMPSASAENSTSATGMLEATNTNGAIGVAG